VLSRDFSDHVTLFIHFAIFRYYQNRDFLLNRTCPFSFASDEFAENTAIFGRKFSMESAIPDTKKPEYVTYKGSKILLLTETNIVSWMIYTRNILIFDDL